MNTMISFCILVVLLRGALSKHSVPCKSKYWNTRQVTSKLDCARHCAAFPESSMSFGYTFKTCLIKRMSRLQKNVDSWIFYRKQGRGDKMSALTFYKNVRTLPQNDIPLPTHGTEDDIDTGMQRKCQYGGSYVYGYCIIFLFQRNRFCQNKWICNNIGMKMIEAESEVKFQHLTKYLNRTTSKDIWLGATDMVKYGHWKWIETDQSVGYTNWAPQKGVSFFTKRCMAVGANSRFKWVKTLCIRRKELLCEYRWDNVMFPSVSRDGKYSLDDDCEHYGRRYKQSCYVSHQISVTWPTALKNCAQWNMRLVSITSQDENDFLQYILKYTYGTDVPRCIWIGLNDRRVEGTWEWQGGKEPVVFKNWAAGKPSVIEKEYHYPSDCAALNKDQLWEDVNCGIMCDFMCELTYDK